VFRVDRGPLGYTHAMRVAWRQPYLILFVTASVLLVLLVIWWGIFFALRVRDLRAGRIAELHVAALQQLLDDPTLSRPLPAELLMVEPDSPAVAQASFVVRSPLDSSWVLIPSADREAEIASFYHRKMVMVTGEGSLLILLVLVSLGAIWASHSKALRLNWEMSNFLQAVTHELRTPLTSLKLLFETLEQNPEAVEDRQAMFQAGLVQISRLERLITNLLKVSALEGHRTRLRLAVFDLSREVRAFAMAREPQVKARQGTLIIECPAPVLVRFDREALVQVLDNLLDNALKYSPDPPVITLRVAAEEAEGVLTCIDKGLGLTKEQQGRVFERFWRAGDEATRTSEGTGLGLYLVRRLVTSAGGRMAVESPGMGYGSTFIVRLPRGSAEEIVPERDLIPGGG
ncbi:MAG: HAMP domain-containing sensor histidine kinase, partial [bacterium]